MKLPALNLPYPNVGQDPHFRDCNFLLTSCHDGEWAIYCKAGFLAELTFESTSEEQAVVIPNQFDGFVEEMYKKKPKKSTPIAC